MSTCNRLDLQTRGGSQPVLPKNLHDHWAKVVVMEILGTFGQNPSVFKCDRLIIVMFRFLFIA